MSYSPTTWQNGDTITAAKLNNMESGITAGENGWSIGSTQLFSETVTTASGNFGYQATLAYADDPSALGTLTITLNGTDYTCAQQSGGSQYWWGAPSPADFSEYPFVVLADSSTWYLITETAGEYTVTASSDGITTTANFRTAAQTAVGGMAPFRIVLDTTTFQEAYDAMAAGRMAFVDRLSYNGGMEPVIYVHTGDYSVVCLHYYNGVSAATYYAASADSAIASS